MTATWTWIKLLLLLSFCNWTNQRSFVLSALLRVRLAAVAQITAPAIPLHRRPASSAYYCHQIDFLIFVKTLTATNHKRNMAGLGDGRFRLTKDGKVYTKGKKYAECGSIRDTYGS
jgi:hypothetical protein